MTRASVRILCAADGRLSKRRTHGSVISAVAVLELGNTQGSRTLTLAAELGRHNIRMDAIAPGSVETEGLRASGVVDTDFLKKLTANTPLGRIGQPEDIAKVVVFLAPMYRAGSPASASWRLAACASDAPSVISALGTSRQAPDGGYRITPTVVSARLASA